MPRTFAQMVAEAMAEVPVTCYTGEMAALGAKLLKDMGFANVGVLAGGTVAWQAAGLPMEVGALSGAL